MTEVGQEIGRKRLGRLRTACTTCTDNDFTAERAGSAEEGTRRGRLWACRPLSTGHPGNQ
jgi:hypothetical protein